MSHDQKVRLYPRYSTRNPFGEIPTQPSMRIDFLTDLQRCTSCFSCHSRNQKKRKNLPSRQLIARLYGCEYTRGQNVWCVIRHNRSVMVVFVESPFVARHTLVESQKPPVQLGWFCFPNRQDLLAFITPMIGTPNVENHSPSVSSKHIRC